MWILRSTDPPDVNLSFRLLPGTFKSMGRATQADFIVDAPLVSRVHCRFTLSETGELEVEDLDSTNGTLVNGRRVTRATLTPGDTVKVGRVSFVVHGPQ